MRQGNEKPVGCLSLDDFSVSSTARSGSKRKDKPERLFRTEPFLFEDKGAYRCTRGATCRSRHGTTGRRSPRGEAGDDKGKYEESVLSTGSSPLENNEAIPLQLLKKNNTGALLKVFDNGVHVGDLAHTQAGTQLVIVQAGAAGENGGAVLLKLEEIIQHR